MFCYKCGAQLADDAIFCMHCGNRVAPMADAAPVAPAAPVEVAAPVVPVAPAAPVEVAAPVTPVTFAPNQEPVYAAPPAPAVQVPAPVAAVNFSANGADEEDAGATTALTPDQAPAYMQTNAAPYQPTYTNVPPYAPAPAAPAAPKRRNNTLLIGIIAIVAVIALTLGALWATGAFDDLFDSTSSSRRDKDKDEDKDGDTTASAGDTTTTIGGAEITTTTTATGIGGAVVETTAPVTVTTAPPMDVMAYDKGFISGTTYYNYWADLMYSFGDNWKEGDSSSYASFENEATDCGLYIVHTDMDAGIYDSSVAIVYEDVSASPMSASTYLDLVRTGLETEYASIGYTCTWSDVSSTYAADRVWSDISVALNGGEKFQRYLVTNEGDYIIAIICSAMESSDLNELLYGLSTVD